MDVKNEKIVRRNHSTVKPTKDPELEAEIVFAKENGIEPPRVLPSDAVKKISEAFDEQIAIDKNLIKNLKNGRAERKARSRGVSGCSIKKDSRFELGLDCIDLALDNGHYSDNASSDSEDEFDEYADYVCKYSEEEIRAIFGDYLQSGNTKETMDSLEKFCLTSDTVFRMVKDIIVVSMEQACGCFDLSAKLIDEMINVKWISLQVLIEVIEEVVASVEELAKDLPKIGEALAVFIAKLVENNIITSGVLSLLASKNDDKEPLVKQCYDDAIVFANNHHLLNGKAVPCGGLQSVNILSEQQKLILKEYLQSNDKESAEHRLKELKVPHFNHEFVYQAGLLALEKMHDLVMANLADLIKYLNNNGTLAESCIVKGFERLYNSLGDLYLDLPAAYALAQLWVEKSLEAGFIDADLASRCPTGSIRTRSRTLSQGPDGKLSCMDEEEPLGSERVVQNGHSEKN